MLSGQTGGGGALASRWTCVHTKKKLFFFLLLFFNLFHHFLRLVLSPLFNHEINYSFPRYANNKKIWEKMKKLMMMMMLDIFKMTRASFILLCRVSYFRKESAAYTPVKCSNLKSISLKKLTDLIENLPYMVGNDLHTEVPFVRSMYHTTKRKYNSKQRN